MTTTEVDDKPRWRLQFMSHLELSSHPANEEIYGDGNSYQDDLLESVQQNGILEPLRATQDLEVLSGHRRLLCARHLDLQEVPVLVSTEKLTIDQQVIEIIESNRQREKSNEQKAREFKRLVAAKEAIAQKRMKAGKKTNPAQKVTQGRAPTVKDESAKQVGMSRPTAKKAAVVVEKIDELKASGEIEQAQVLRDTLNTKSVSAAHELATEAQVATDSEGDDHIPDCLSPEEWPLRFRALPGRHKDGPAIEARRASAYLGRGFGHVEKLKELVGDQARKELREFLKSAKELKKRWREIRRLVVAAAEQAETAGAAS